MKNMSWDDVRAFREIARNGSLTRASAALGVSIATLGRRVDALENSLGVRLVRRTPQGSQLTQEGERVFTLVAPGAECFDQLSRLARSLVDNQEQSPVRISSTEPMIADVLAPNLFRLVDQHPQLRVEFETSLELSNLNRGDADIAIRMVKPKGDTLIAQRLPSIKMGIFASSDFIDLHGSTPDLAQVPLLWYDHAYGDIAENVWLREQQLEECVIFRAGSVRALLNAAMSGLGAAPLPEFLAHDEKLLPVREGFLRDRSPWLVFHRENRANPAMKTVRSWIVDTCKRVLIN